MIRSPGYRLTWNGKRYTRLGWVYASIHDSHPNLELPQVGDLAVFRGQDGDPQQYELVTEVCHVDAHPMGWHAAWGKIGGELFCLRESWVFYRHRPETLDEMYCS